MAQRRRDFDHLIEQQLAEILPFGWQLDEAAVVEAVMQQLQQNERRSENDALLPTREELTERCSERLLELHRKELRHLLQPGSIVWLKDGRVMRLLPASRVERRDHKILLSTVRPETRLETHVEVDVEQLAALQKLRQLQKPDRASNVEVLMATAKVMSTTTTRVLAAETASLIALDEISEISLSRPAAVQSLQRCLKLGYSADIDIRATDDGFFWQRSPFENSVARSSTLQLRGKMIDVCVTTNHALSQLARDVLLQLCETAEAHAVQVRLNSQLVPPSHDLRLAFDTAVEIAETQQQLQDASSAWEAKSRFADRLIQLTSAGQAGYQAILQLLRTSQIDLRPFESQLAAAFVSVPDVEFLRKIQQLGFNLYVSPSILITAVTHQNLKLLQFFLEEVRVDVSDDNYAAVKRAASLGFTDALAPLTAAMTEAQSHERLAVLKAALAANQFAALAEAARLFDVSTACLVGLFASYLARQVDSGSRLVSALLDRQLLTTADDGQSFVAVALRYEDFKTLDCLSAAFPNVAFDVDQFVESVLSAGRKAVKSPEKSRQLYYQLLSIVVASNLNFRQLLASFSKLSQVTEPQTLSLPSELLHLIQVVTVAQRATLTRKQLKLDFQWLKSLTPTQRSLINSPDDLRGLRIATATTKVSAIGPKL